MSKFATFTAAAVMAVGAGATPAGADKGGVPHNGGGNDQGQAAQPATPAQPAQPTVAPATPAKPAKPGRSRGHHGKGHAYGHHKHTARPEQARPQQSATAPEAGTGHGKTTICHATGSQKNPYVEITISDHALAAHRRHQDGRDIIPAPAGGCPTATTQGTETTPAAPSGTAPAGSEQGQATSGSSQNTAGFKLAGRAKSRGIAVLGAHAVRPAASSRGGSRVRVLGAHAVSAAPVAAVTSATHSGGGLPFTGLQLGLLVAIGLATLLGGIALRRSATLSRR